jgi:hypothetical protein
MRPLLLLLLASISGCLDRREPTITNAAPAPAPAPSSSSSSSSAVADCLFEGKVAVRAGEKLRLGEAGDIEARFTGHEVSIRVREIDASVASVIVGAPSTSPALTLHGKVAAAALPRCEPGGRVPPRDGGVAARKEDACAQGCPDEKGGPFHARRKVAVRNRPSPEGEPLGWLEEDGEVRIVGREGTYAKVEPLKGELVPPPGGLWIDEATLDPRKN